MHCRRFGKAPIRRLLSRGKTPPLRNFWLLFFRCVPPDLLHSRLVAADASLFSCVWCRLCRRRTIHPSGSRPRDVSPAGQTSAPGTCRAPENRQFPALSNRILLTNAMAPLWVPFSYGSRQRRRQTPQSGRRPSVKGGVRTNQIDGYEPLFQPVSNSHPPRRTPQPNALWTSKGTRSRMMS